MFSKKILNDLRVYKSSSLSDLFLKHSCYKLTMNPFIVRNMEHIYNASMSVFGINITSFFIKNTVGKSFIGGENNLQMS